MLLKHETRKVNYKILSKKEMNQFRSYMENERYCCPCWIHHIWSVLKAKKKIHLYPYLYYVSLYSLSFKTRHKTQHKFFFFSHNISYCFLSNLFTFRNWFYTYVSPRDLRLPVKQSPIKTKWNCKNHLCIYKIQKKNSIEDYICIEINYPWQLICLFGYNSLISHEIHITK